MCSAHQPQHIGVPCQRICCPSAAGGRHQQPCAVWQIAGHAGASLLYSSQQRFLAGMAQSGAMRQQQLVRFMQSTPLRGSGVVTPLRRQRHCWQACEPPPLLPAPHISSLRQ